MAFWALAGILAVLVGVPSFIAGWVAGGFHALRRCWRAQPESRATRPKA